MNQGLSWQALNNRIPREWMAGVQLRLRLLLLAESHELERTWRASNFPGPPFTVGKPVSDKVPSKQAYTKPQRDLKKTLTFHRFLEIITLCSKITDQWEREHHLHGKKAAAVIRHWKFPRLTAVKCSKSKVNISKAHLRFTSIRTNRAGQVSPLVFGYQGQPLL